MFKGNETHCVGAMGAMMIFIVGRMLEWLYGSCHERTFRFSMSDDAPDEVTRYVHD